MIAVLQKACPRLADLISPKSKDSPTATQQPRSEPIAKEAVPPAAPVSDGKAEAERALKMSFDVASAKLAEARSLFAQLSGAPNGEARKAILGQLSAQANALWSNCQSPGLESVCKVAKSLERLLKLISEKPTNLTPSTLRTTAASIVLLESLCKPGMRPDLATNPAPRFLSIDDDPVSLRAIASSLEQAFDSPDHAENGAVALQLVAKKSYDIIFLDVEMPGMNGFEVCSRIRQARLNAGTPVVFVTIHHDFDSRTKASEASGQDLIAKPFLSSELTLKALTILVRRRMQALPAEVAAKT